MGVWIGLVGVAPNPGSLTLSDRKGAYVNAFAWVSSEIEFENTVRQALNALQLFAFEFEDVEPFEKRMRSHSLDAELLDLAAQVGADKQTRFGTFHTYRNVDG